MVVSVSITLSQMDFEGFWKQKKKLFALIVLLLITDQFKIFDYKESHFFEELYFPINFHSFNCKEIIKKAKTLRSKIILLKLKIILKERLNTGR